jgi:molecular chaperone HscB
MMIFLLMTLLRKPSFDVNLDRLRQRYLHLQKSLHPDRFTHRSKEDQVYSADYSGWVNQAYHVLKHPISRATYLLELKGVRVSEDETARLDSTFLMKVMSIREAIADARSVVELEPLKLENQSKKLIDEFRTTTYR